MTVYQTARFKVRPEALEKCEQAIRGCVASVQEHEPGTLLSTSVREREDPTSFLHSLLFQDEAARDTHRHSKAVKRFTDVLYPRRLRLSSLPSTRLSPRREKWILTTVKCVSCWVLRS
jgi:quinol monooxygenase YgiN